MQVWQVCNKRRDLEGDKYFFMGLYVLAFLIFLPAFIIRTFLTDMS